MARTRPPARKYLPGLGKITEVRWLDNESLDFGDDEDVTISWDGSNLNIMPLVDDTGAILIGDGTTGMDLKVFGSAVGNYMEWDKSLNVLNVVVATKVISGEEHAVSVVFDGELSAGEGIVGVNVSVTPKGTAGQWASAFFGKVNLTDANDPIPGTGYASGAEFEVNIGSGCTPPDAHMLVLNDGISCAHYAESSYIRFRKYGATYPINLFKFDEEDVASTHDSGRMIVETNSIPAVNDTGYVLFRTRVGTTDVWLIGTKTAPAA